MAATRSFFQTGAHRELTNIGLPVISEGLNSVRTYQFEVHFDLPSEVEQEGNPNNSLTLAAKQVTAAGFSMEPIEVNRVNDKVFYPGKAAGEEITITFDNLLYPKVSNTLWNWFSSIYNPMNGQFNDKFSTARDGYTSGWKSQKTTIVALNPHGEPTAETRLYGVFPISWKTGEFNYNTNEFHTIEMVLRYDFMEQVTAEGV